MTEPNSFPAMAKLIEMDDLLISERDLEQARAELEKMEELLTHEPIYRCADGVLVCTVCRRATIEDKPAHFDSCAWASLIPPLKAGTDGKERT